MDFNGRTAIVTGAARGIGRAIALELGRQGCKVAFNYSRSAEQADSLAEELAALGRAHYYCRADVADYAAVECMVKTARDKLGSVDYLVNNAGINADKLILRMTEAEWDSVMDTNLKGAFHFSKAVAGIMMRARFGSILNITSVSGVAGMAGQANYSASKAGMIGLTKALARELAGRNITVNALALGFVETEMVRAFNDEYKTKLLQGIPLGRFGNVREVGRMAAFLLSADAGYITGQVIQADGGIAI
jgi:3-oxoacyl-[acyl-carrier protein] reductase